MRHINTSKLDKDDLRRVEIAIAAMPLNAATDALLSVIDHLQVGDVTLFSELDELTPSQAVPLLGMSRPMVYRLIDSGELSARVVGRRDRRIPMASIRRYLDRNGTPTAA